MYFTSGGDRAFESLMQGKPGFDHYDSGDAGAPEDCGDCRFYRPDWKYARKYGVSRASRKYNKSRSYIYFRRVRHDDSLQSPSLPVPASSQPPQPAYPGGAQAHR